MTGKKKLIITGIFFAVALIVSYLVFGRITSSDQGNAQRDEVIAKITKLEFKKQLTEEEQKKITDEFATHQEAIQRGLEEIRIQGERVELLLYWPIVYIGNIHRNAGAYDKAELAYTYASQLQPNAFVPYLNLAQMYFRDIKDYPKAAEFYEKAAAIEGFHLETVYDEWSQLVRFQLNDEAKAEQILIEGVNRYPQETNILAMLANFYRDTGQKEKAIERYEELLARNPESIVAKNALNELRP